MGIANDIKLHYNTGKEMRPDDILEFNKDLFHNVDSENVLGKLIEGTSYNETIQKSMNEIYKSLREYKIESMRYFFSVDRDLEKLKTEKKKTRKWICSVTESLDRVITNFQHQLDRGSTVNYKDQNSIFRVVQNIIIDPYHDCIRPFVRLSADEYYSVKYIFKNSSFHSNRLIFGLAFDVIHNDQAASKSEEYQTYSEIKSKIAKTDIAAYLDLHLSRSEVQFLKAILESWEVSHSFHLGLLKIAKLSTDKESVRILLQKVGFHGEKIKKHSGRYIINQNFQDSIENVLSGFSRMSEQSQSHYNSMDEQISDLKECFEPAEKRLTQDALDWIFEQQKEMCKQANLLKRELIDEAPSAIHDVYMIAFGSLQGLAGYGVSMIKTAENVANTY